MNLEVLFLSSYLSYRLKKNLFTLCKLRKVYAKLID